MGQKSNQFTLNKTNIQFNLASVNNKVFFNSLKFLKFFEFLLKKRGVIILNQTFNVINNNGFLSGGLFFMTNKVNLYKKKIKSAVFKKLNSNSKFSALFFKVLTLLRVNLITLSFSNINKSINPILLNFLYLRFKKFTNTIFQRRFNLFIDFLKLTTLFCQDKVPVTSYVILLAQIFRSIAKRLHTQFFSFLKILFKTLVIEITKINSNFIKISGVKCVISGKLQGKARATKCLIVEGSVPTQTRSKNLCFAKTNTYTLLGAFGFKIWILKN
jgi:hypothetical protein